MVGSPKKHFLPLLIVSFFALFFFSHYHSSLPLSSTHTDPNFTLQETHYSQSSTPFVLLIKVLAFNRLESLSRCLRSLAAADYGGDTVHLHVYIDHFDATRNDSRDYLDEKLEESHGILAFADKFEWRFGNKVIHYRTGNVGLQAQWLETWWPSSENEFAFVVEDDLEVSPLFYKFVKSLILNFYYNSSNFSPSIYGVSLQRPRFVPGKHGNKIHLDSGTRLFLYQLVGTWGQILFPNPWKEFRLWYDKHKTKGIKPVLDGMVTNGWYKKMGERIWTPWFIKFIHSRGYFNIYTNFLHERALSVSHRDAGVNYGKTAGPDSQLLDKSSLNFNILEMQPLSNLKWYDFCFREVLPGRVVRTLDELGFVLPSVQKQDTILLVSLYGTSEIMTRNLICHFERLNISNYILIGPQSDFLYDLARRGRPVIDADHFLNNLRGNKLTRFLDSNAESKEVLLKAIVIKKCLEHNYNSWLVDGNMLFVNSDLFPGPNDPDHDFYAGKSSELFYIRSSSSAQKVWSDDFFYGVGSMLNKSSFPGDGRNLLYAVLKEKGVRIKPLDETRFGMYIGTNNVNLNSSKSDEKMVYWSSSTGFDLVRKQLEELRMWVVDGDSSCTAVICHQS
ncbi:putative transferase transferring glycosyl groups [Tripterygium wilfordii]|uniref:Putative transferase transferring glycosyl groups n=1 Tax=Tripterygium wilfordii TaxID=458696 RepID=A0A7J7DFA1_TRIWF|nr:uncharacterized protein LOC120002214 [Tripterygium wilfordii]KAF5745003.1 putative transferase transferring glycosyl groups [Tripterygium wilfordii]